MVTALRGLKCNDNMRSAGYSQSKLCGLIERDSSPETQYKEAAFVSNWFQITLGLLADDVHIEKMCRTRQASKYMYKEFYC